MCVINWVYPSRKGYCTIAMQYSYYFMRRQVRRLSWVSASVSATGEPPRPFCLYEPARGAEHPLQRGRRGDLPERGVASRQRQPQRSRAPSAAAPLGGPSVRLLAALLETFAAASFDQLLNIVHHVSSTAGYVAAQRPDEQRPVLIGLRGQHVLPRAWRPPRIRRRGTARPSAASPTPATPPEPRRRWRFKPVACQPVLAADRQEIGAPVDDMMKGRRRQLSDPLPPARPAGASAEPRRPRSDQLLSVTVIVAVPVTSPPWRPVIVAVPAAAAVTVAVAPVFLSG